jgi:ABC-type amino acid transport substrate-binding protein
MQDVYFWNGNKSPARQSYETALLQACLQATNKEYAAAQVRIDNTDYALAEDEGNIFATGADILVTVAGNVKFDHKQKIVINQPLAKGLLGYRLIIARDASLGTFNGLKTPKELQALAAGIPLTWADAELFRHNNYTVIEKGGLDDLFVSLKNGTFDYVTLGVNEIEQIFQQQAVPLGGLSIEPSLMIYYPFPLVFYVNPDKSVLAERITTGLKTIINNGVFEKLFTEHYGQVVQQHNLHQRRVFNLTNPSLPSDMLNFKATLLDE